MFRLYVAAASARLCAFRADMAAECGQTEHRTGVHDPHAVWVMHAESPETRPLP
jgi:hypothetical protein